MPPRVLIPLSSNAERVELVEGVLYTSLSVVTAPRSIRAMPDIVWALRQITCLLAFVLLFCGCITLCLGVLNTFPSVFAFVERGLAFCYRRDRRQVLLTLALLMWYTWSATRRQTLQLSNYLQAFVFFICQSEICVMFATKSRWESRNLNIGT